MLLTSKLSQKMATKSINKAIKSLLIIIALTFVCNIQATLATDFTEGERLRYKVSYLGMKAGEAELLFKPNKAENKYQIIGRAWSKRSLSFLIKLKDRVSVTGLLKEISDKDIAKLNQDISNNEALNNNVKAVTVAKTADQIKLEQEADAIMRQIEEEAGIVNKSAEKINAELKAVTNIKTQDLIEQIIPQTYQLNLNENDYKANKKVTFNSFDATKPQATFQNIHANLKPVTHDTQYQARDMISALYYLRAKVKDPKIGDVYKLPVFDLNSTYNLELHVKGKEKIDSKIGKVETLHIQPVLLGVKERNKKDKWHFWVTNDGKYTPVKIEVKLRFGAFRAEIQERGDLSSRSRAPSYLPETGKIK